MLALGRFERLIDYLKNKLHQNITCIAVMMYLDTSLQQYMWYFDAIYFWQLFERTVLRHSAAWSSHRTSFVVHWHCVGSENYFCLLLHAVMIMIRKIKWLMAVVLICTIVTDETVLLCPWQSVQCSQEHNCLKANLAMHFEQEKLNSIQLTL